MKVLNSHLDLLSRKRGLPLAFGLFSCLFSTFRYTYAMLTLTAEKRDIFGKKAALARKTGKMPVVVYGAKQAPVSYFVQTKDFKKTLADAGESTLVAIKADGSSHETLIHDVAYHPVTGEPVHADFYVVDQTKTIQVAVHLEYVGEAPAEKGGFILVKVLHELEVEALPKDLPHGIEVDISTLVDLSSHILVKDLKLPAGVTAVLDAEAVVANVAEAKEEPVEEVAPADLSTIEVEEKGKKEEEAEAPAAE